LPFPIPNKAQHMNTAPAAAALGSSYKDAKRDRRRREILNAAAGIFARKGYFAATMQDIADALSMRPASLYYYFESKEATLEEVCRLGGREFTGKLKQIFESGDQPLAIIENGVRHHLALEWRDYVTNFAFNRQNLPDGALLEMNTIAREYTGLWKAILDLAKKKGILKKDLDTVFAANSLLAICNNTVTAHTPVGHSRDELTGKVVEIILSGIGRH